MLKKADARGLAITVGFRLAVCAVVMASGFEAVSDDDFARVVHALDWAAQPRFDASQTSWLPLPFWLYGAGFSLVGGGWLTAKIFAVVGAVVSSGLLYLAARWFGAAPRSATVSAVVASALSWSAILGNAPVPELFAASCTLVAVASLGIGAKDQPSIRRLAVGGGLLLAATLCRYEPWLVVPWFVYFAARRAAPTSKRVGLALIPMLGPAIWMLTNYLGHGGDPLHFLSRVAAYRQAFTPVGTTSLAIDYLRIFVFQEPELWMLLLGGIAIARFNQIELPPRRGRLLIAAFVFVMLSVAALRGGAATHHEGRALLVCWLALALWAGELLDRLAASASPKKRWVLIVLLAATTTIGPFVLRAWFARRDAWADRKAEIELGRDLRAELTHDARVLVDTPGYGHFAVMVGLGTPQQVVVLPEPIRRESTRTDEMLTDAWRESGANYLATPRSLTVVEQRLGRDATGVPGYRLYIAPR